MLVNASNAPVSDTHGRITSDAVNSIWSKQIGTPLA
jgi:hypothetical protein